MLVFIVSALEGDFYLNIFGSQLEGYIKIAMHNNLKLYPTKKKENDLHC